MTLNDHLAGRSLSELSDAGIAQLHTLRGLTDADHSALDLEMARRKLERASPVKITGIDIPFGDMVGLILKWSLAAIPALIILSIIGAIIGVFLGAIIAGIRGAL